MAKKASPQKESSTAETAGNVDQIRDILFGSQMKDYEKKFSNLEERILLEVSRLKDDSNTRFDSLESYINKEIEVITKHIKSEKEQRNDSIKSLASDLKSTAKSIENNLGKFESSTEKEIRELRQALLEQSKTLLNEIANKHDEGMAVFDRTVSELRDEKVSRSTLSGMLTEVAIRLADDSGNNSD